MLIMVALYIHVNDKAIRKQNQKCKKNKNYVQCVGLHINKTNSFTSRCPRFLIYLLPSCPRAKSRDTRVLVLEFLSLTFHSFFSSSNYANDTTDTNGGKIQRSKVYVHIIQIQNLILRFIK